MTIKTRLTVRYVIETPHPWPVPQITIEVPLLTELSAAVAAGQHLRSALCELWGVERRGINIHVVMEDVTSVPGKEADVSQLVGGR